MCNLGCRYCVPEKGIKNDSSVQVNYPLHYKDLFRIAHRLGILLNIQNVRLTGGEPTLYPDLIPFTQLLSDNNFKQIRLTSNGYLLSKMIIPLKEAGLSSINISLDTLEESTFVKLSKTKSLHKILNAIDESLKVGLGIKVNMVVMKGINSSEVTSMLDFCGNRNITIRFLELMKMGHLFSNGRWEDNFVSENEILDNLSKKYIFEKEIRGASSTSNYWTTSEGFRFGIIANESSPFCNDCDRLRLDSYGNLYGCLSTNEPIPIANIYEDLDTLSDRLMIALKQKQPVKFSGSELSMIEIGG
jgi:cyclic pyranopterin phosphate synthase